MVRTAVALSDSTCGVSKLLTWVSSAGLWLPLPEGLDDAALRVLQYPNQEPLPSNRNEPDRGSLAGQVKRKRRIRAPRVTRPLLWTGHLEEAEQAGKSSFDRSCYFERLSEERAQTVLPDQVEMRFDLASGDLGFTDVAGKSVPATKRNGVVMQEILVGCFRLSHLTYAEAEPEQTPTSWATRTSACPRPRAG